MNKNRRRWLQEFAKNAEATDQLVSHRDEHVLLLALGLFGEAGSVLAELKKSRREGAAYPALRETLREEVGDFLWYYVRLVSVLDEGLLSKLTTHRASRSDHEAEHDLTV